MLSFSSFAQRFREIEVMAVQVVIEQDAFMRMFAPILDPSASREYFDAVADFFAHDEPHFAEWVDRVRQHIPALYPAQVHFADGPEEFKACLKTADACLVESLIVREEELSAAPRLAVVQKYGALTRNIDSAACAAHGVAVRTQRRRVNVALAELAFALLSALGKQLFDYNKVIDAPRLAAKGFQIRRYDQRYTGGSNFARIPGLRILQGMTLGILGFGEAGREIAARARAFEMKIVYNQRTRLSPEEEMALGVTYASRLEMLAQSDYVTVNLPVTEQTRNILGDAEFAAIKPGAFLINVARPELVERQALFKALDSGRLAGYGTDVWYERPARSDDPVFGYDNVLVMPHIAIANRKYALMDIEDMFVKMSDALEQRNAGVAHG
jgi:glyoxylate reductase